MIILIWRWFPSSNRLKGTYLPPEISISPAEEYVEAICDTLLNELQPSEYPQVYLETGRALIDEAGFFDYISRSCKTAAKR